MQAADAASQALLEGALPDAITSIQRGLSSDPDLLNSHAEIVTALLQSRALEEELEHYLSALEDDVESAPAPVEPSQLEAALALFRKATTVDPLHATAHYTLGRLLLVQEQFDESARHLALGARLQPNREIAYHYLGRALQLAGRPEEAIKCFRHHISLNPLHEIISGTYLAQTLVKKGDLQAAVDQYRSTIHAHPGVIHGAAYRGLGTALHLQGRLDDALDSYFKSIEIDKRMDGKEPLDANLNCNIARAFHAKGAWNLALPRAHRAWFVHRNAMPPNRLSTSNLLWLARFFEGANSPFAAAQIGRELVPGSQQGEWAQLFRESCARCQWSQAMFLALELDSTISSLQRAWITAVLYFYLGDPVRALEILDEAETRLDPSESDSADLQHYLSVAASAILAHDAPAIQDYAIASARRTAQSAASTARDLYYAGLILLDSSQDNTKQGQLSAANLALDCFDYASRKDRNFLPSLYMRIWCLHRLGKTSQLREEATNIVQIEQAAQQSGFTFLAPLEPITLTLDPHQWLLTIERLAYAQELSPAIQIVRVEATAHADSAQPAILYDRPSADPRISSVADLFRVTQELAQWHRKAAVGLGNSLAEDLRRADPIDALSRVDQAYRDPGQMERWLGHAIDSANTKSDLSQLKTSIKYAVLRRYLSPMQAVHLACYLHARPLIEHSDHVLRSASKSILPLLSWMAALPFVDPLTAGLLPALAAPLYHYLTTPLALSSDTDSYRQFQANFEEWLLRQHHELGSREFHNRYPLQDWLPEAMHSAESSGKPTESPNT